MVIILLLVIVVMQFRFDLFDFIIKSLICSFSCGMLKNKNVWEIWRVMKAGSTQCHGMNIYLQGFPKSSSNLFLTSSSFSSGSLDSNIHHHDVRVEHHLVNSFSGHSQVSFLLIMSSLRFKWSRVLRTPRLQITKVGKVQIFFVILGGMRYRVVTRWKPTREWW